jgi:hypothetical protein
MALSLTAFGQSVPNGGAVSNGQIWSATQWNSAWQSKADTNSAALTGSPTVNGVAIGTVSSVSATAVAPLCVSGVPFTTTGTLSITWCSGAVAPVYGGTGVAGTITGIPYANGTSAFTAASAANVATLFGCTTGQALGYGGGCISPVEYNVQNTAYAGGADPTGSADSTAAIQAAISAACTAGGILKFPHGTYNISSTVNGCNSAAWWMSIEGDAEYKTYINWTGATPTLSGVTISGTAGQFACSSCTGMVVGQTLTLSGTYGGTGSITGYTNPTQYRVSAVGTNTFTLQTLSHGALTTTAGTPTGLTYTSGQSVFYMLGWGSSTIRNVTINTGAATNIVGWDIDTDTVIPSTENLTFTNDLVQGSGVGFVGWRLGLSEDGTNDYSFINWENSSVHGNVGAPAANSVGWLIEGPNALNLNWFGGNAYGLANGFSDVGQSGHIYNGNGSYAFYGWGTSGNTNDFLFNGGGQYQVYGGRFEQGTTFMIVSSYLASSQIIVSGAQVAAYPGTSFGGNTGVVVELTGSVSLQMESTKFEQAASSYTSSLITIATNGGPVFDNITFLDDTVDGSFPFYNIVGGNTGGAITIRSIGNVQKSHSGESAIALFPDVTGAQTFNGTISGAVYTVATLPTCTSGIVGALASVNNGVTSPTYFGAVSTTGTATDPVYCNYNGSTYGWVYH